LVSSCGDSSSTTNVNQTSESDEAAKEISADAKLDAEWQKLVVKEPELTAKCEPFIKYRLGRNEVLEWDSLLASISASQSVVDESGNQNLDVKLTLTKQRQSAEKQKGLAYFWFNPWRSEAEGLLQNNKKLSKACNFGEDDLIDNMR